MGRNFGRGLGGDLGRAQARAWSGRPKEDNLAKVRAGVRVENSCMGIGLSRIRGKGLGRGLSRGLCRDLSKDLGRCLGMDVGWVMGWGAERSFGRGSGRGFSRGLAGSGRGLTFPHPPLQAQRSPLAGFGNSRTPGTPHRHRLVTTNFPLCPQMFSGRGPWCPQMCPLIFVDRVWNRRGSV